jgi:hypothetical protein
MAGPPTCAAKSLLRDIEFAEHVLIEGVINIDLDPIQTADALLELFGQLAINHCAAPGGIHLRDDGVGPPAGFGVIVWAHGPVTVRKTFRKEAEVKKSQIAEVLITISPHRRRHLAAALGQHFEHVLHLPAGLIFKSVEVFDLNELCQEIGDVLDRVGIAKIQLSHPAFSQLLKERPDRMICWNLMPGFLNHAPNPLVT